MRRDEIKQQKDYYRKRMITGYENSLKEGITISNEDVKKISNNFELGAFVRSKFNEKQNMLESEIIRLKKELNSEE